MQEHKICTLCDNTEVVNESCAKCHKPYCALCASKIDPGKYCDECLRDVVIEETTYVKSETDFDLKRNELVTHTSKCKQIIFKGIDWMFAAQKICTLTDEELKPILYYHKAFVSALESEILNRGVKKSHSEVVNENGSRVIKVRESVKIKTVKTAKLADADLNSFATLAMKLGIMNAGDLVEYLKKQKKPN